jgi:hypothetical protein
LAPLTVLPWKRVDCAAAATQGHAGAPSSLRRNTQNDHDETPPIHKTTIKKTWPRETPATNLRRYECACVPVFTKSPSNEEEKRKRVYIRKGLTEMQNVAPPPPQRVSSGTAKTSTKKGWGCRDEMVRGMKAKHTRAPPPPKKKKMEALS